MPVVRPRFIPNTASPRAGAYYNPATNSCYGTLNLAAASDCHVGGTGTLANDADAGCLRVALGVNPASAVYNGGIAYTANGCIIVSQVAAIDHWVKGWPISAAGELCVA